MTTGGSTIGTSTAALTIHRPAKAVRASHQPTATAGTNPTTVLAKPTCGDSRMAFAGSTVTARAAA